MKTRIILIVIAVMLVTAGGLIMRYARKHEKPPVTDLAGFIASVKVERKQAGEDTLVNMNNFWYKGGAIYAVDVSLYKDANGDGIGDLKGLVQKLDHIQSLGADAIWLRGFRPSVVNDTTRSDSVTAYSFDARLGTMEDLTLLMEESGKRNIRVIMDLLPAATSFTDTAQQEAIDKMAGFWMNKGASGLRLNDSTVYWQDSSKLNPAFSFEALTNLRHSIQAVRKEGILFGDLNIQPEEASHFFGKNGEGFHLLTNYSVNQYFYYALATGEINGLTDALEETRGIPSQAQWAQLPGSEHGLFLNQLTERERSKVLEQFGTANKLSTSKTGAYLRPATLFGNDRRRLELAWSLFFALPGTPVIQYGDEIGLGNRLSSTGIDPINSPMPWSDSLQAGFSRSRNLISSLIDSGLYSYKRVNVRAQMRDTLSFMQWMKHLLSVRQGLQAIGRGNWKVLPSGTSHVLVLQYHWEGKTILTIHNLSTETQEVKIASQGKARTLDNLLKLEEVFISANDKYNYSLEPLGYRWYEVK